MSKTNWENIITGDELKKIKALRNKTYIESKERAIAYSELLEEGWTKIQDYICVMLFNMWFQHLNKDRHFEFSYDSNNERFTQQIDVFAADEETVLIIECKSAESIKEHSFKTYIEKMHGIFPGISTEIRKKYPGAKIKQIFATQNYILGDAKKYGKQNSCN